MTSRDIANALARTTWSVRKQIIVPNVSWGLGIDEADLVVLYDSGWMEEVEIKISRADFNKEFTKKAAKHERLVKGIPELNLVKDDCRRGRWVPDYSQARPHKLRKFWFAMPYDLAKQLLPQIPEHAGLLAIGEKVNWGRRQVFTLKHAPKLAMARKLTEEEKLKLLRLAYLRYWDIRGQEKEAA